MSENKIEDRQKRQAPDTKATYEITIFDNGSVRVEGPLDNTLLFVTCANKAIGAALEDMARRLRGQPSTIVPKTEMQKLH